MTKKDERFIWISAVTVLLFAVIILIVGHVQRDSTDLKQQKRINEQTDLIRDMRVITNAYDNLIVKHEELQKEYQDYKKKAEMIQALEPLKDFFTDNDILSIIDQIPHGNVFDSDFLIMAGFGDSVTEHGIYRSHKGIDIIPTGDNWMITPIASGLSTTFIIDTVYGKAVTIQHSDIVRSLYAHGSNVYYRALPGEQVDADTVIMHMGNTGLTYSTGDGTGSHLHLQLEVWTGAEWVPIDPLPFLNRG